MKPAPQDPEQELRKKYVLAAVFVGLLIVPISVYTIFFLQR